MSAQSCPHFDRCSAPLCPIDAMSLEHGAWFPDEEVCRRADHRTQPMVRTQRRIARLTAADTESGCFTGAMLLRGCRLTRKIKGLDPDSGPITAESVVRWLRKHPQKRLLTEEERAVRRARATKIMATHTNSGTDSVARTRAPETPPPNPMCFRGVRS